MSELIKRTLWVMAAGVMSHAVQAADIDISGVVVASACVVETGSVSQDVDLGRIQKKDLQTAGSAGDWQPFLVKLVNCPSATTTTTATFSGTPFAGDATLYDNVGTATGVAVQMAQDVNKSLIQSNGSSMTVNVDAQRNATYALAGRTISPTGAPGTGTVISVVQMNFTYQ